MEDLKVIIVEGKTDRARLKQILAEPVEIICTHGTMSKDKLEELIWPLADLDDVYILVDADDAGNKLRSQLKRELPNARHLYTRRMFREVATTPTEVLAEVLAKHHFDVHEHFLGNADA
ncbi:MAG: toprim domain-containing protein [Tumebacillaceae bacterium]